MSRNPIGQRALSLLLSLTLVLGIFGVDTVGAYAAQSSIPTVLYLDSGDILITDSGYSVGGGPIAAQDPSDSGYRITQNGNGTIQHTITVQGGTQDITVENININVSGTSNACAFSIAKGAAVNLTLEGQNMLKSGDYCAGLQVPGDASAPTDTTKNASLTVTDASTGSLNVTGGSCGAGIGGGRYGSGGSITINGGTVTANSGYNGAGIGGGYTNIGGSGGTITVTGGTVTATGNNGAGIGGGYNDAGGTITVTGGTVTATGNNGAGIGGGWAGGWDFSDCSVTISGGSVTATGGDNSAGIGSSGGRNCVGSGVTISGGSVTATGGNSAAGIGGGEGCMGDTVKISGTGTFVTAKGNGGKDIGSGNGNNSGGSLSVLDGATVTMQNSNPSLNTDASTDYKNCQIVIGGTETKYDKDGNVSSTQRVLYLDSGDIVITETGYSVNNGTEIPYVGGYWITQNGNGEVQHSITVHSGTQNITLCNVHARPNHNSAFEVESGLEADITLVGSNSLDTSGSSSHRAGLAVNAGNTVHISGSGSLTATGGDNSAGIGGNNSYSCGTVEISGGTVTANGGVCSAGIGGGAGGAGGNITITGGIVNATGGNSGAGIGGNGGAGSTIKITGGIVNATGGNNGAGIGGASYGAGGDVTICGSNTEVTAKGQNGGEDIGSGDNNSNGGTLIVGDSNTAEPLPVLKLLSAGTNGTSPDNSRPQFMNCVIQGAGAINASGADISGCYDAIGKIRLSISMQTPASAKIGETVTLNASVTKYNPDVQKYQFNSASFPGTVQFTGNSTPLGSPAGVTNGTAQISWTPANGNEVWLKAAYDPATNDRYGSAESIPFDYTPGKATPVVSEKPTASAVTAGSPLSASKFSGGKAVVNGAAISGRFQWVDPTAVVTGSGDYPALFVPEDTADYNNTSYIMIPVTVTPTPAPTPTPQNNSGNSSHDTTTPSLPASLTDTPTSTTIDLSGATFPAGVTSVSLSVAPETANGAPSAPGNAGIPSDPQGAAVYHLAISQTGLNLIGSPFVYNIQLLDQNGNPITSFSGTVTVKVAIPAGIHGTPHIFRYEESTGTFTDLGATVQDGYLVFTTTHFSYYVIAGTGDSITLDTKCYQMPVGGSYQIGVRLTGSKAATVKFHSTNDKTATATRLKNGNIQVTAKGTSTAYIMIDVYDSKNHLLTHASVKIDVKTGIRPRGDSTRQIGVF